MKTPEIVFIAPFAGLEAQAREIVAAGGYPAEVLRGDLYDGVIAARSALMNGAKVVISRGGTAKLIQSELGDDLPIGVIEVEASVYSIVEYLHQHARDGYRAAVIGFPQFTKMGKAVCECMAVTHRLFEINDEAEAMGMVKAIRDWDPDVVLGDTVSHRLLTDLGWKNLHLIESSLSSVGEAFERATLVLDNLHRQLAYGKKLATVLECSLDGVVILDGQGVVEDMNRRGLDLMGLRDRKPAGRLLSDIVANSELSAAVRDKREAKGLVIEIHDERLVVDLAPLEDGGLVMTVRPIKQIQDMENKIRAQLHNKGFYARRRLSDINYLSDRMRQTIAVAAEYAKSDANIVVTGETGTGKELFAQGIHNASARADGMFVAINCAALPAGLLESELFGYSPGAFTGASRSGKTGLFEIAHKGTLFLDEINEMDPFLQTRLLRAIQEREIMRIGDSRVIPVDVRIIAAANKDLEEEVDKGKLRHDLFFRLNVLNLHLPPLRKRDGDITHLFRHYLAIYADKAGVKPRPPGDDFFAALESYPWPGNVRELENLAERYIVLQHRPEARDPRALLPGLSRVERAPAADRDAESLDDIIRSAIREALEKENGNIQRASRRLGVNRNTVKRWMRGDGGEN